MNKKMFAIVLGATLIAASLFALVGCAHQHNYEVYYQHADCDTEGYTLHTCAECGYQYRDEFTEPLGHAWRTYYHMEENVAASQIATCSLTRDSGSSSHYSLFTSVGEDALRELIAKENDIAFCKHPKCEFCNDPGFLFYESGIIDMDSLLEEMGAIEKKKYNEHVTVNVPSVETRMGIEVPKTIIRTGEFDATLADIGGRWTLNIPDSIIGIQSGAFRRCGKLDRVKISANLKYIDAYALNGAKVPYLILPKTLEYVGDHAFGECTNTMAIYYCGTEEQWNKIQFENPRDPVKGVKVYFYNEKSTTEGKYWRYNGDGEPYADIKITYVSR